MECLTIGASEDLRSVRENLLRRLPSDSIRSISFSTQQENATKMQFLDIHFSPKSGSEIAEEIDNVMALWIRQKYESRILRQIIMTNYGYFSAQEQAHIFRLVADKRKASDNAAKELHIIRSSLSRYLAGADKLFLDGFVRFRLREYWTELENAVEEGVDEFLLQREYEEFIDLLKLFVEMQTPQTDFLHIISHENGNYCFLDKEERNITRDCTAEFIADVFAREITYGDMLISILIVMAPKQILWHRAEYEPNEELIQTARMIFGEKLAFCGGCTLCGRE